jgi:hypothetical protein
MKTGSDGAYLVTVRRDALLGKGISVPPNVGSEKIGCHLLAIGALRSNGFSSDASMLELGSNSSTIDHQSSQAKACAGVHWVA